MRKPTYARRSRNTLNVTPKVTTTTPRADTPRRGAAKEQRLEPERHRMIRLVVVVMMVVMMIMIVSSFAHVRLPTRVGFCVHALVLQTGTHVWLYACLKQRTVRGTRALRIASVVRKAHGAQVIHTVLWRAIGDPASTLAIMVGSWSKTSPINQRCGNMCSSRHPIPDSLFVQVLLSIESSTTYQPVSGILRSANDMITSLAKSQRT